MTLEELKEYDGRDGRPVYVAYKGKIYDLSKSDFWAGGTHMGQFKAGQDLTSSIGLSPHGEANLFRYPVVGEVTEETDEVKQIDIATAKKLKYQNLYRKFHPHPIMVHFAMGIYPFAFFMQVIAFILNGDLSISFSFASLAAMVCATLFAFPAIASGVVSLIINYNGKPNIYLKRKIILSVLLVIVGSISSTLGILEINSNAIGMWYTLATAVATIITITIGYNGGKLTWPN